MKQNILFIGISLYFLTQISACCPIMTPDQGADQAGSKQAESSFTDPHTGMEFVLVPGGCFEMGSAEGEVEEQPVHQVCVDDFYLGKHEVTQGEWLAVMGSNPAYFKNGDNFPVESVSWFDTEDFTAKLNTLSALNYRLPTEAEWEYAARSGGKQEKFAGSDNADGVAWHRQNSTAASVPGSSHEVGQKQPNGLGLFDMSGNLWEWCADWYGADYYQESPDRNPQGPTSGAVRVGRGGSWYSEPNDMRTTIRGNFAPAAFGPLLGFRLVLPIE